MYNWERAMKQRVREIRRSELSYIFGSSCLRALNIGLSFASSPLISLATFGSIWLMGEPLKAADIFTTMSFFALIRMPITAYFPYAIEKLSEARISARRIDEFLKLEMLVDKREKEQNEKGDLAIIMENASFSWKDSPCLSVLNSSIKIGTLVGIKGATGAGKSSLLAAILGEMNLTSGKLRQYVNSISYAPQSAWIFADTIRANILLGKPMDEERYKNVIKACCLDIDLRNFGEVGDLMIVGDKGVNLSGGQKARISLARALYADADLYLLDDPIAAVDPKVAKKIFDQCIGPRSLLREKTRILVTHQTHFLVEANQTILLKNGRIDELHIGQSVLDEQSNVTTEVDSSNNNETNWTLNTSATDINSIVQDEMSTDGAVKWNVWLKLFIAPPLRWFGFFLLIVLIFAAEALFDGTNRWLALWSEKSEKNESSSSDANIYLGLTLVDLFQWAIRQSAEAETYMTSAERVHEYGQLLREDGKEKHQRKAFIQPPNDWPSRGIIEFKNYTFRYRPELDPVLKNLNLRTESKEKIGIIGRTGAGKSSILQALFRLVDQTAIAGTILIDDIDISRLSRDSLRSHLSVIPQVPILFCGTLRYNLDPFKQASDEECLRALEAVQLKH
ncbi:unnamed protein product [Rotaria sordida]|uniref:ABC transporter domain-containing protein n=1 Tax=Rotaria sordida TaxID=392033 RepID=A0A815G7P8_9BILA|nr:unnamed protein product [Rotaria sordida]CAF1335170.1 unnamed protein product [Rotaria sordida]